MIKKSLFTLCFSFLFATTSFANTSYLGLSGGSVNFDKDFKSTYILATRLGLLNKQGLGFEFNVGYAKPDTNTTSLPELTIIPISIGINYYFNPQRKITPYFGGFAAVNLLGEHYDTTLGFGGKVGMLFKIDPQMTLFFEGIYHPISSTYKKGSEETDITITSTSVSFGLSMTLGNASKKKTLNKKKRRPDRAKRKRNPNQRRNPNRF